MIIKVFLRRHCTLLIVAEPPWLNLMYGTIGEVNERIMFVIIEL